LLSLISGILEPTAGSVLVDGARVTGPTRKVGYMLQQDYLFEWRTILENTLLGAEIQGADMAKARARASGLLTRYGLGQFLHHLPRQLSGGMRQRVALARTFLSGRPLVLLDEPFASLDQITRGSLQQWLADALREEPRTVVLVTHDVQEALYLADRVAIMSPRPGRIVAELAVPLERPRPRRATITSPDFAALERVALDALEGAPA
jgi:NitT/TauT family transport system ATP-binding protein